jgi:hypothetical protein
MVHPETGLAAKERFLSIAAANEWLERNLPVRPWKPFTPEPAWTPPTAEQRERGLAMWKKTKALMLETAEAMRVSGRITGKRNKQPPAPIQRHDPEGLMRALEFGEQMKPAHDAHMPKAHRSSS